MDRKREKRGMQCYMKKEDNSLIDVENVETTTTQSTLTFAARSAIIYFGKNQGSCDARDVWAMCERLANVLSTNYFRRTDENPLLWTYHYAQRFFWRL